MKKRLAIRVRGHQHSWSFEFQGDSNHLDEWRADGLEVDELINSIPEWAVDLGLLRPWVFLQDLFNFRNPFNAQSGGEP